MTRQRTETETKNVCPKPGFSFIDTHRRQYNERTFGTAIRYICRPKHKLCSPRLPLLIKTAFKNGYYCVNLFGSPEFRKCYSHFCTELNLTFLLEFRYIYLTLYYSIYLTLINLLVFYE